MGISLLPVIVIAAVGTEATVPLAVGGGLLMPPGMAPGLIETIAPCLRPAVPSS
jgi:hypothetical protein